MQKVYVALIVVNEDTGIVDVSVMRGHGPGTLRFQTAWPLDNDSQTLSTDGVETDDVGNVLHPDDGHEVMTYNEKDEAIGEAMTSLRDNFDNDEKYDKSVDVRHR